MTSSKYECILVSDLKMSDREQANDGREEEEELVRRVGGRGRDLVQAVLRVRRERAGRTPPNLLGTPNAQGQGQEVGHVVWRKGDWENFGPGMLEIGQWTMALGLLTWELIDKEGQNQVPPPTPRQPYDVHIPPVGHLMAPHRYPEVVPPNVFPLPPYSENDSDPPPHYDDLFPPGYTPFPNPNTHLHPSFSALPPVPSFPLDPPPSYNSLFATAVSPDCTVAPSYSPHIS